MMQDAAGNNLATKKPVAICVCSDKCFYAIILWIKTMSHQVRLFSLGTLNELLLKEYYKLCHDKKDTDKKETGNIITNPELSTNKMLFPKWLRQIDNYSILITREVRSPLTYLQLLDTEPVAGNDLDALPTLNRRQVRGTHHSGPEYEQDNRMLWSLIWDRTEDGPAWTRIRKLRTSLYGWGILI